MTKKHLYILTALVIVFAGLIFAVAYGTSNPAVFGHTASEIEGLSIPKFNSVVGTTDIPITSTSYVDMPDMTYTDTFTTGNILVMFDAPLEGNTYLTVSYQILVDGVSKVIGYSGTTSNSLKVGGMPITWAGAVTAGSHTIKVQWKVSGGTGYQYGTKGQRVLTIMSGFN